jgi:hypothetical protein
MAGPVTAAAGVVRWKPALSRCARWRGRLQQQPESFVGNRRSQATHPKDRRATCRLALRRSRTIGELSRADPVLGRARPVDHGLAFASVLLVFSLSMTTVHCHDIHSVRDLDQESSDARTAPGEGLRSSRSLVHCARACRSAGTADRVPRDKENRSHRRVPRDRGPRSLPLARRRRRTGHQGMGRG